MAYVSLKTLKRGPTVTVIVSLLAAEGFQGGEVKTETIDIDGLVDVSFKWKISDYRSILPFVRIKGKTNVTNAIVQIQITTKEFNAQFFCSVEWVEVELKQIKTSKIQQAIGRRDANGSFSVLIASYFMEVDITAHKIMPVPLQINQLYEDTEFTDFQLQATDGNVAVHKTVLLAQSDVFKAMMRGQWKEKAERHISIDGVTVQTLQHLKDYMYLGTLPDEGLEPLLVVAARYLMDKLKMGCITKLAQSITPKKMADLVKLACQHNIPELVEAILHLTPDSIICDFNQLKIKDQESSDKDKIDQV